MDKGLNLFKALVVYFSFINIFGFFIMFIDKKFAIYNKKRISEKNLLLCAIIGGAAGVWISMYVNRHKTLKPKFKFGVPLIFVLNIAVYYYLV